MRRVWARDACVRRALFAVFHVGGLGRWADVTKNIALKHTQFYAREIVRLPDPRDDESQFQWADVDISWRRLMWFSKKNLISKGDEIEGDERHWWRVNTDAYVRARDYLSKTDQETLPCGHTGVYNVPDGGYECSECGRDVTREQAEAVVFS